MNFFENHMRDTLRYPESIKHNFDIGQWVRFHGNGLWIWPLAQNHVSIVKIEKHKIVRRYSQFIAKN